MNGFRDFPISNIWQKWNHNIWRLTIQLAAAITQSYFGYTPNPIFWRKTKWTFRSKSVRCICCAAFPLTLFFAGCLQRQDNLVKPKMTGSDCLDFRVQVIDWIQVQVIKGCMWISFHLSHSCKHWLLFIYFVAFSVFKSIFLWVFCPYVLILKPYFFPFWLYLLQNFRHKKTTGNNRHPLKETWRSWIILSIVSVQSPLVSIVSLGVIMTWWCLIWKKSKRGEIQLEVPTQ